MHDHVTRAAQTFIGALDELGTTLHEHLNGHALGNQILFDQLPHKIIIRLTCSRKTDFNFAEAHLDDRVEHPSLAHGVHGIDQSLIAIAQIYRTPKRRLLRPAVRPCSIREIEIKRLKRSVFLKGHPFGCQILRHHDLPVFVLS